MWALCTALSPVVISEGKHLRLSRGQGLSSARACRAVWANERPWAPVPSWAVSLEEPAVCIVVRGGAEGGAWVHTRHSSSQTGLRQSRPAAEKMRLVMRLAHRHFPAGWAAHAFLWSTVNVLTLSRISRTGVGIRAAFQKDTGAMFRDRCR